MKLLTKYELERFTTVEFLPFGLDWTCVAEIQFSENKDLPNDNDPPRRQKVRNSTVELGDQWPIRTAPFLKGSLKLIRRRFHSGSATRTSSPATPGKSSSPPRSR